MNLNNNNNNINCNNNKNYNNKNLFNHLKVFKKKIKIKLLQKVLALHKTTT